MLQTCPDSASLIFLLRKTDIVILLETPDTEILVYLYNLTEHMWIQTSCHLYCTTKGKKTILIAYNVGQRWFFLNPENLKEVTSSGIQNPEAKKQIDFLFLNISHAFPWMTAYYPGKFSWKQPCESNSTCSCLWGSALLLVESGITCLWDSTAHKACGVEQLGWVLVLWSGCLLM